MTAGIVTGLVSEARVARSLGRAVAGGGTPTGAAAAARRLADEGVTCLLSVGLAGGLAGLRPGHVIVPDIVIADVRRFAVHRGLAASLGGSGGTLFAARDVVATASAKRHLHNATGADAVDLESGEVAAVAAERGLPFAVLRAICDPVERDLPPAALAALDSGGAVGIGRVLRSVAGRPGQIPALLRLAREAAAARAALMRRIHDIHLRGGLVRQF